MKVWTTKRKNKIFQVLNGRNNCYLIPTASGNILIDTGMQRVYQELKTNIVSVPIEQTKVDFLILTHTHFDHCRNAAALKKEYGCEIIVGEPEFEYIEQGYTPLPEGTNAFTRFLVAIGKRMGARHFGYQPFSADIKVDEFFQWKSDDIKIDIMSTPGHSIGSISLIIDDEIAIVGDVMIKMFGDSIFPPFADDIPTMLKSWKKLLDTGCRLFLPGHRPPIARQLLEKQYQKYK